MYTSKSQTALSDVSGWLCQHVLPSHSSNAVSSCKLCCRLVSCTCGACYAGLHRQAPCSRAWNLHVGWSGCTLSPCTLPTLEALPGRCRLLGPPLLPVRGLRAAGESSVFVALHDTTAYKSSTTCTGSCGVMRGAMRHKTFLCNGVILC